MTPEDLADLHPHLYHVAPPSARELIAAHGLLSPLAMVREHGVGSEATLTSKRLDTTPIGGGFVLNDNSPLIRSVLERQLADGLTPEDWMRELNSRVFLFPRRAAALGFVGVKANRERERDLYTFRTTDFASAHAGRVEVTPLNTGATFAMSSAPKGMWLFTPLEELSHADWRVKRRAMGLVKGLDRIREVCVRHSAPHAMDTLVSRETLRGGPAPA